MIEVLLELKLEAFLVNSMGKSDDISSQKSAKALKLSCEKIISVHRLNDNKPSADFEFLGATSKGGIQSESDEEFDTRLFTYLTTYTTVDTSRVNIAAGTSGYIAAQKGISSGEIGRLYLAEMPNQRSVSLELVFKPEEFEAAWELMAQQKIRKVIATLGCFKLLQGSLTGLSEKLFVAGVMSCSLQLVPND